MSTMTYEPQHNERRARQNVVLIVEDHSGLRTALQHWLSASLPDCRLLSAASGEEGIAIAQAQRPGIALLDVRLPGVNGIQATRDIKAASPQTQVVMLTQCEEDPYRADAFKAGASAYALKRRAHQQLLPLLQRLLKNEKEQHSQQDQDTHDTH